MANPLVLALVSVALPVGWAAASQTDRVKTWSYSPRWEPAARFLYYVGLPYLAVVGGVISPRLLGLTGVDHLALIEWGNPNWPAQLQAAAVLILLDWLFDVPATLAAGGLALLIFAAFSYGWRRAQVILFTRRQTFLQTVYYALHWAFYRAIFWAVTDDLYLATVWGAAAVLVECSLVYWIEARRQALNDTLTNTIILILTATVFFYSVNWWLLLPVHAVLVAIANATVAARRPATVERTG